jgi:hypothetical protein
MSRSKNRAPDNDGELRSPHQPVRRASILEYDPEAFPAGFVRASSDREQMPDERIAVRQRPAASGRQRLRRMGDEQSIEFFAQCTR